MLTIAISDDLAGEHPGFMAGCATRGHQVNVFGRARDAGQTVDAAADRAGDRDPRVRGSGQEEEGVRGTRANPGARLRVAAVDRLHMVVDGRALCGRAIEDADVYEDKDGLPAWNDGPLEPCAKCTSTLVARIRQAARPVA